VKERGRLDGIAQLFVSAGSAIGGESGRSIEVQGETLKNLLKEGQIRFWAIKGAAEDAARLLGDNGFSGDSFVVVNRNGKPKYEIGFEDWQGNRGNSGHFAGELILCMRQIVELENGKAPPKMAGDRARLLKEAASDCRLMREYAETALVGIDTLVNEEQAKEAKELKEGRLEPSQLAVRAFQIREQNDLLGWMQAGYREVQFQIPTAVSRFDMEAKHYAGLGDEYRLPTLTRAP
jgi:hypothetical protein